MSIRLTDLQKVSVSVAPVDAKGNPTTLDAKPIWSTNAPTIISVTPSDDALSCTLTSIGALGSAQISVSAEADLGAGLQTLSGVLDIEVVASKATALNINAGTPEAA